MSSSVPTAGDRKRAASSSSSKCPPAAARRASLSTSAGTARTVARSRAPWISSTSSRKPAMASPRPGTVGRLISALRARGQTQLARETAASPRGAKPAREPAPALRPARARPLHHALDHGQDLPPGPPPVGEHHRLVHVRAPRQHLDVEQLVRPDVLHLDRDTRQPRAEGGHRVGHRLAPLDTHEHPVAQDGHEEDGARESVGRGSACVDELVGIEPKAGQLQALVRAPEDRERGAGAPAGAPSTTDSSGRAARTRAPVRWTSSSARGNGTSQLMLPAGTATAPPDCAISWTRCAGAAMKGKRFRMTRPGAKVSGCAVWIARAERSRSLAVSHTEFDAPVVPDDSP